jgi:hypothetical protein
MQSIINNKLIISVCSTDVIHCLTVYEPGDVIVTPYKPIQKIYEKLGIEVKQPSFLFLVTLFSKYRLIHIYGQGPTFYILYFRRLFLLFNKNIIYSDSYLQVKTRMLQPPANFMYEGVKLHFPEWLQRLVGFDYCSEGTYHFLHCRTMMEPIIEVNPKIAVDCKNSIIILDEILILFPKLLDFNRLASKHTLYLKRKSRSSGMIDFEPSVLELFTEYTETIIPIEMYSGYHSIIGHNSTALKMPKSISICQIVGQPNYNWATFVPDSLEELYIHLDC